MTTTPAKILLIGSTGVIGSRIAAEARNRGHEITEASRSGGAGRLTIDLADTDAVTQAAAGHAAIVLAISPPRDGTAPAPALLAAGRSLIEAATASGVKRVLLVGGAGSLRLPDGARVVDQPWFPDEVRPEALAQADLLELFQNEGSGLDWSYLSPAGHIEPGNRTGDFTLGGDGLVTNADGESNISAEDYAVALVDEMENPAHVGQRFTLGYT